MKSFLLFFLIFFNELLTAQDGIILPSDVASEYKKLTGGVGYNQLIRPILSDKCFVCHGNDANKRQAGLRLDVDKDALAPLPQNPTEVAIFPKQTSRSELVKRILSKEPTEIMPEPKSNLILSAKEKALLIKWIEEGAVYQPHWAFLPPQKNPLPTIQSSNSDNPVDLFIHEKLEKEGFRPGKTASKEVLLRRVSFDLTGLPPTLDDLNIFLTDSSGNAFEKQVDRLLQSPHYGEKMAVDWLDLARFADSHGYTVDRLRDMSPYRDWVITAYNSNMPYNTFIQQQLAGDLMPNSTLDMKIATAFNRNHPQNMEGGIIEQEFQTEYVIDRTNTFGETFMGLSVGCARCHDHKFDPFSQKNYYELFAFFNSVQEAGQIAWDDAMPTPTVLLPTKEQEKILKFINESVERQEQKVLEIARAAEKRADVWIEQVKYHNLGVTKTIGLIGEYKFENNLLNSVDGKYAKMRRETDTTSEQPLFGRTNKKMVLALDGDGFMDLRDVGLFRKSDPFTISVNIKIPKSLNDGVIVHKCIAERLYNFRGFSLSLRDGKFEICMVHTAPSNAITRLALNKAPKDKWINIALRYDGASKASGFNLFQDGELLELETTMDQLYKDIIFHTKDEPAIQIGGWWRGLGFKGGQIGNLNVYNRELTEFEIKTLAGKGGWEHIRTKSPEQLTQEDKNSLKEYYIAAEDGELTSNREILKRLRATLSDSMEHISEIMVMQEMPRPRKTFLLHRGNYDAPTEQVFPNVSPVILPFAQNLSPNRYGLAQWLTDPRHPLTSRVMVNRIWQMLFVTGIVSSSNDFGSQGTVPSHPELLDWLSIYFMESGWDIKKLIKTMVMSETYQRDSRSEPGWTEKDPENRLLARGPVQRLSAEMIRDNALMASELLNTSLGGKSVRPYQPDGLWEINNTRYIADSTNAVYKRSLYVLVKRSVPNPTLATFDAPDRSNCTGKRQRTNTPLQALVTLNDPTYIEACKVMGEYMTRSSSPEKGVQEIYRKLTGVTPNGKELHLLLEIQKEEYEKFVHQPEKIKGWLNVGLYSIDPALDARMVAANSVVASVILNSDGTLTKR